MRMVNKKALSEDQKAGIVRIYTSGDANMPQIAERFGVSPSRISQIIDEWKNRL